MPDAIADSTVLVTSPELIAGDLPDEMVLLHQEKGIYYGLNAVGARVWQLLNEPTPFAQVVETICDEFEVDKATCRADVDKLVGELIAKGLVETRD